MTPTQKTLLRKLRDRFGWDFALAVWRAFEKGEKR
jgi:hypothetical protein